MVPDSEATKRQRSQCEHELEAPGHQWYALRIRSNFEKVAATHLEGRGYKPFLPSYRSQRTWSDRSKAIELPLFPGYLFCAFVVANRLPILSAPGVIAILGAGKLPIPVDPSEIDAIHAAVKSGLAVQPWPYLQVGETVRIERGALRGIEGILINAKKKQRLVLSVALVQRSVAVEVDRDWVCPVRTLPFGTVKAESPSDSAHSRQNITTGSSAPHW